MPFRMNGSLLWVSPHWHSGLSGAVQNLGLTANEDLMCIPSPSESLGGVPRVLKKGGGPVPAGAMRSMGSQAQRARVRAGRWAETSWGL